MVSPLLHTSKQLRMARKCRHGGSKNLSDLPCDIIFSIFSRLPADILFGIRSVCKLWNKLIRDPDFIELHLSTWMLKQPSCLIIAPPIGHYGTKNLVFVDGIEEGHWRGRKIQVEYLRGECFVLHGCSNGLICVGSTDPGSESIFICNPITGESMCLPKSNLAAEIFGFMIFPLYCTIGFGFDHATKKYKVVRIGLFPIYRKDNQNQYQYHWLVEVLTIGESSWRKLDVRDEVYDLSQMLFLNGFVYWISYTLRGHQFILALDIGSEKFGIIDVFLFGQDKFLSRLMNMDGSLALVTVHSDSNSRGVKISKIWRIVGSMATGFSFEQCSYYVSCRWNYASLYGLFSDGNLLLKHCYEESLTFALYHPTKNKYLPFQVSGYSQKAQAILFMPSLVSLPK